MSYACLPLDFDEIAPPPNGEDPGGPHPLSSLDF